MLPYEKEFPGETILKVAILFRNGNGFLKQTTISTLPTKQFRIKGATSNFSLRL